MMRTVRFSPLVVAMLAIAIGLVAIDSRAATRTWIGGNDPWDTDAFNWTGTDEPDPDDDVVFNTNNHVEMDMDNEILSLTISGGLELDTESFFLDVNGDITLSDDGTILRAGESATIGLPTTSVSAYNLTVNAGATFANANFTSIIHPSAVGLVGINADGTLLGHGEIRVGDGISSPTVVFSNDGVIRPGVVSDGFVISSNPTARTLTLAAIDSDARIDLDGTSGGGAIDIRRNQTLDIDVQVDDDFDGTIDMAHNSTLDIADAWEFAGTLNVANGFVAGNPPVIPNVPADAAYLAGGAITMAESTTTINVLDEDGTLQFDAAFTANDGTIANHGLIVFNADAAINSGVDFQMIGVEAGMTVGPGATVAINDVDMDFDGAGASTNVITVEAGGLLELNLDSFEGNDRADGYLTLNSGELDLTVADGSWTMERRLTLNNTDGGMPTLSGSAVVIGDDTFLTSPNDADVRVQGNGSSVIRSNITFNSDADIDVDSDATLAVLGFSTFDTVNGAESAQFDGPGNIYFSGGQVNEATTLDFSGGTVGLDSGGAMTVLLSAPDFTIDAPLTINAAELDDYGRSVVFPLPQTSELTINGNVGGRLDVHLDDPNGAWTVNGVGVVHLNGGAILFSTLIDGSDLSMNGTMNVDGFSRVDARVAIGSTGAVNFNDAAANLRLRGGDFANTNRLDGGTINGTGELSANDGTALHGHGTVAAAIDFDGATSELMADDGTLTVSGALLDVGIIGTADSDGVLNVTTVWDTAVTQQVRLNGGEITGAAIDNFGAGGIHGQGLVSATVRNETEIVAEGGGTLVFDNPLNSNDWDGPSGAGTLRATPGNTLQLHDNAPFLFSGTVSANNATVRSEGFELEFDPGSTLLLQNGGVYRSTQATDLGGNVQVNAGAPSRVAIAGSLTFESTSTTTLNGDLELNANTRIEAGATFAGGSSLRNLNGGTLTLLDGADVDVLLLNQGVMALGASPGQATGLDFMQAASGTLAIELQGTGLMDYDRLDLTGQAQLDGELDVSLLGGFMPALGDTFTILSALVGVNGQFATLDLPSLGAGLGWNVAYNPTLVNLTVVELLGDPDFNQDGNLDCLDVDDLVAEIVAGTDDGLFDLTGDGNVDEMDLSQWLSDAGAVNLASGNPYLPGDANLDGDVNGADFDIWNANKFSAGNGWCGADYNADGITNGQDFLIWNANKFMSADNAVTAVPEPRLAWSLLLLLLAGVCRRETHS